jgi:hypothetical protein
MLSRVRLVEQWRGVEDGLPENWADARLSLTIGDDAQLARASALLTPLAPGRSGRTIRFFVARRGAGPSPGALRRALERLDRERIAGELELVASGEPELQPETLRQTLAATWDAELAALPGDWSDIYAEVELRSGGHLERAALLCSPLNPSRFGGRPGFRFRCARSYGYGTSPGMVRRCLARLDEVGIQGTVKVLRALSDTDAVSTQGPVWYVGGRSV